MKKQRVVLDITYDEAIYDDPELWHWIYVIDGSEEVRVVHADEPVKIEDDADV